MVKLGLGIWNQVSGSWYRVQNRKYII